MATALVLAAAGCWKRAGPGVPGPVDLGDDGAGQVRFTYLGVGGWIIERGEDVVITPPLFSRPSLWRTGLWNARSDTAAVNRGMAPYDVSDALGILVGHGHYDHLMDVPQLARRHAPRARILANRTSQNLLGTWSGVADRVDVVDDLAGDVEHPGSWIPLGRAVRVMALRSHHAAHILDVTLFHGTVDRPLTREPTDARAWLDGPSLAFLIDFLGTDGSVVFRVYYTDAVAQAPAGLVPEPLIDERPVDVAILVPATFDHVEWHPEAIVENLRPRWVLLGHWEDFFTPVDETPGQVFVTDELHFEARLERVHPGGWWRPSRGAELRFPVG